MIRASLALARADDVDDGVRSAGLVQVDAIDRTTVHRRLGLREAFEDAERPVAHHRCELRLAEQALDLLPGPPVATVAQVMLVVRVIVGMGVRLRLRRPTRPLPRDHHVDVLRCEPAALDPAHLQLEFERQRGQLGIERLAREAGVEQRRHEHVARHPRRRVDVQRAGGAPPRATRGG